METAVREFGGLDVCFANAGVSGGMVPLFETTVEQLTQILGINLIGTFLAVKHAARIMVAQHRGSIICTASVAALRSGAGGVPYSASKAGVISLVQTAANQLYGTGVRVNAICPGLIETGMTQPIFDQARSRGTEHKIGQLNPLRRAGAPIEIAHMALFLASDDASYVNGQAVAVDGGLSSSHPVVRTEGLTRAIVAKSHEPRAGHRGRRAPRHEYRVLRAPSGEPTGSLRPPAALRGGRLGLWKLRGRAAHDDHRGGPAVRRRREEAGAACPGYDAMAGPRSTPGPEAAVGPDTPAVEARVSALLGQMTLDEKIGQMIMVDYGALASLDDITTYFLGALLPSGDEAPAENTPQAWLDLTSSFRPKALATRLGIPLIVGIDAVHGDREGGRGDGVPARHRPRAARATRRS